MASKELREITQGVPTASDFVVGVTAGNLDRLFPVSDIGGGSSTLAGLSDVLISAATDGQVLCFNGPASKWENDQRVIASSAASGSGSAGKNVTIQSGNGDGAGAGGEVYINGGAGTVGNGAGGAVYIKSGAGSGNGSGGAAYLYGGRGGAGVSAGGQVSIAGAYGTSSGGRVSIQSGSASHVAGAAFIMTGSVNGIGAGCTFHAGPAYGFASGGSVQFYGGDGAGQGGTVRLRAGKGTVSSNGRGGFIDLAAGAGAGTNGGGDVTINAGGGGGTGGYGGYVYLGAGNGANPAGKMYLYAGNATASSGSAGGPVTIRSGNGDGAGVGGNIILQLGTGGTTGRLLAVGLPSSDPSVTNALWSDNNIIVRSGITGQIAFLNVADQTVSGGANVTSDSLTTGNITVDCGARPLQFITNGGAFTITAPASDGSCMLLVTNNASAGTITFSGFSVGTNKGDALDTTNGHKFTISVWRINSVSGYRVAAHQ